MASKVEDTIRDMVRRDRIHLSKAPDAHEAIRAWYRNCKELLRDCVGEEFEHDVVSTIRAIGEQKAATLYAAAWKVVS